MNVTYSKQKNGDVVFTIYTPAYVFKYKYGHANASAEANPLGMLPIVEYPVADYLGIFEPVVPLVDALNALQSNRLDDVAQYINSFLAILGAQVYEETYKKLDEWKMLYLPEGTDLSFKYTARTPNDTARIMCVLGNELNGYTRVMASSFQCLTCFEVDASLFGQCVSLTNKELQDRSATQLVHYLNTNRMGCGNCSNSCQRFCNFNLGSAKSFFTAKFIEHLNIKSVDSVEGKRQSNCQVVFQIGITGSPTCVEACKLDINFKLWEGNIESTITDNRFIGVFKILGTDIDNGVVPIGADIECEYEISVLFSRQNFIIIPDRILIMKPHFTLILQSSKIHLMDACVIVRQVARNPRIV